MKVPPEKEVCQGDVSNDTFLGMNSGKSAAGDGSGGAFASGGLGFSYSDAQVVAEEVPQPLGRQSGLISFIVTLKWSWRKFHNHSGVSKA